jgi:hypothetical protein
MVDLPTPRAMVRAMLQGEMPPRPLLLPIIFELGARLENLSLDEYRTNPTKIAKALRQIHGALPLDGVTCYIEPELEISAMNRLLERQGGIQRDPFRDRITLDDVHDLLESPEDIAGAGSIPAGCEVLKRLKVMLAGEPLLMVGVTGPFALASQLWNAVDGLDLIPRELVDSAAGVTATVSKRFLESGANAIFICEKPPTTSDLTHWTESLSPIVNVIRFYEALPIVLFQDPVLSEMVAALSASCEGVICPATLNLESGNVLQHGSRWHAISLPSDSFLPERQKLVFSLVQRVAREGLCLLTSQQDILPETDLKRLAEFLNQLRDVANAA